jgi:hypothetical protein
MESAARFLREADRCFAKLNGASLPLSDIIVPTIGGLERRWSLVAAGMN